MTNNIIGGTLMLLSWFPAYYASIVEFNLLMLWGAVTSSVMFIMGLACIVHDKS